jgi:hypothetical protein
MAMVISRFTPQRSEPHEINPRDSQGLKPLIEIPIATRAKIHDGVIRRQLQGMNDRKISLWKGVPIQLRERHPPNRLPLKPPSLPSKRANDSHMKPDRAIRIIMAETDEGG